MQFTNLFTDDDAVSPVIGVILMVAITVILAAVIGTFVLGLGDQVSNTSPTASFSFDFDNSNTNTDSFDTSSGGDGMLTITHDGGDSLVADNIDIKGSSPSGGNVASDTGTDPQYAASDELTAGDSIKVRAANSDTVRVTWSSPNGGDTATLGKWTGPDA